MKTLLMTAVAVGLAAALAGGSELCFGDGEKVDGLNKICYYSCPSGKAAITVKSSQLCPVTLKR